MPRADVLERLWKRVDVSHPRKCWEWQGATTWGYGLMGAGAKDKLVKTHRLAWEDFYGPIPPATHVLHRCDNPPCCNPYHLFLGDDQANVDDMRSKDRHARGERNGHAKLTDEIVLAVRQSSERNAVLARRYGVAQSQISRARSGDRWKHLGGGGSHPTR